MKPPSLWERVLKASGQGALLGVMYLLLGLVFATGQGRSLSHLAMEAVVTARVYVPGGIAAGAIVGILQPLITTLPRALAVFAVACIPLAFGLHFLTVAPDPEPGDMPVWMIAGFAGLVGGTLYWFKHDAPE